MKIKFSRTKIILALLLLLITFFVWQQGLRDSLSRPSVSFDINLKEKIAELARQSTPENLKIFENDPVLDINNSLSEISFIELSERNKLILMITSNSSEVKVDKTILLIFEKNYKQIFDELEKKAENTSYASDENFRPFKEDKFLYHLLSRNLILMRFTYYRIIL